MIEDLQMDYSGIIGVMDRKINLKYIHNFIRRWGFRAIKKAQYPGVNELMENIRSIMHIQ